MVGILTPPADLESQRSLSGNLRKGEISPLSSDHVPSGFDRGLGASFRYMDQNSYGFFPPPASSSFSSWAAGSGKGTSAEGLSKPRLVKTRRRVPSSEAKPGFNPFQSGADRRDVSGTQGLPERFLGLNPFDKLPSGAPSVLNANARDASGSENSGSFESVSSERCVFSCFRSGSASNSGVKNVDSFGSLNFSNANSSGFVVSDGAKKNENLNKNSSNSSGFIFSAGAKENKNLHKNSPPGSDDNSGLLYQMSKVTLQSNDNEAGCTTTMLDENSGLNHSTMFGSNEGLFYKCPEDMRKLNLESSTNEDAFAKEKQATHSSKVEREKNFILGSNKNASISSQFGTAVNFPPGKWSDMSQRASVDSDDGPLSKLPEEMRKLNLQSSISQNVFETPKEADHNVKVDGEAAFIFGTDKNMPTSFHFGSSVHHPPEHISKSKQNSSLGSEAGPFSKRPEEMRKLNLQGSGSQNILETSKEADQNVDVDGGRAFIFGAEKNNSTPFQFGSGVHHPRENMSKSKQKPSLVSEDGPFSKLPEEMRKLNLQSSGSLNIFEVPKEADHNIKVDGEGAFMFETDKNMPTSFDFRSGAHHRSEHISKSKQQSSLGSEDGPFSKLPEEMRKLNLQNAGSQNILETSKEADHNVDIDGERAFIFGAEKNNSTPFQFGSGVHHPPEHISKSKHKSSLGSEDGPFSKLPEEMRKLNLQSSGNQNVFETRKEADHNVKVDGERAFIFGTEKNSSSNFQFGSSAHHPPEHISKPKQKSSVGSEDSPFSKLPEEMSNLNLQSSSSKHALEITEEADLNSEVVGKNASTSFKFSSYIHFNQEKGLDSSDGTSHGYNDIPFSTLQEEKNKLYFGSSSSESAFEAAREADHCSKVDGEKIFIFGGDKNTSMSFPFVGTVKADNYPSERSSNTVQRPYFNSDDSLLSQLPEEMKKLNLQSSSREHGFERMKEDDHSYMHDGEKTFIFGSAYKMPNCFQFGNSANCPQEKSSNMGEKSTLGSDHDLPSKVPDVSSKMNLQGLGNENGYGYTDQVDHSQNLFRGFNGESFSVLPDEMRELNMKSSGNRDGLHNSKPAAQNSHTDGIKTFLSGSSKNESSSFRASMSNEFAEKMKASIVIEKPSADANKKNGRAPSSFVFGSLDSLSSSMGGSLASTLPADMIKEQCTSGDSPMDASSPFSFQDGNHGSGSNLGEIPTSQGFGHSVPIGANLDTHDPSKFSFQAKKQDAISSMGSIPSTQMHTGAKPSGVPKNPFPTASTCHGFQSFETDFFFGKMNLEFQTPHVELKTTSQASSSFCENFFMGGHQNMEFGSKKGASKATQLRKKRGKLRQSATFRQSNDEKFISREKISQGNPDVDSGEYSPMDYSPYQDNLATDQCSSREASAPSDESVHLPSNVSTDTHSVSVDGRDGNLFFATLQSDISEGDLKHCLNNDSSQAQSESTSPFESPFTNVQNSEIGRGSFMPETEGCIGLTSDARSAATNKERFPFSANIDGPPNEDSAFIFESHIPDSRESKFTFSASSSSQGPLFSPKRHSRRKDKIKADKDLCNFTLDAKIPFPPKFSPASSVSQVTANAQGLKEISIVLSTEDDSMVETHAKLESRQGSGSTAAASIAAQEACENWRLRGNQAYANGHLPKAEEYYTRGINSVSPNETLKSCLRVLMLCYSNRAAARMSLGRMREALSDSLMAAAIDPNFPKAQLRAANCHLALGETLDAVKHYQNCLQSERAEGVDHKIFKEASDGLGKAQLVAEHMDQSEKILLKRASTEANRALELISDALSISPFSEKLLEMKAKALFVLRKYDEVIALCEKTLDLAEKNAFLILADGKQKDRGTTDRDTTEGMKSSRVRLWRWHLISKSNFYLGKLDEALELLQKQKQVPPVADKCVARSSELCASLSATISELLRLKSAGNEAFQAGRYLEAVESYTAALTLNIESRPFTAICFCNRAAAYQALGQITDAIADCSLAIALDAGYAKAISRRATLHEMIRDYDQASNDLRRLICLLGKQSNIDDESGTLRRSNSNANELKRVHLRLSMMEDEARKEIPLDMYLILGIESSSSEADLKKAYRKAALRHHPDKVSRFFVRSENADEGFWKEVADEVRTDADRLFKLIHEAYTTLSDPTKRLQYDTEEEIRTSVKKGYCGSGKPKAPADKYCSPYEKSTNGRQWREGWKPYGNSQYRWSDSSRSNWQY